MRNPSGIASPELADETIAAQAKSFLAAKGNTMKPLAFEASWAIDWDAKCQDELLHMDNGPAHVFQNILDCIDPAHVTH